MESIEATRYALVSFHSGWYELRWVCKRWGQMGDGGFVDEETKLIIRFNLVNHNNHGVDASKYSK
jgi:hypothetical protein